MRKALTISFLLLANIAVLAHSAIPHHYHEGIPAAVIGVCNTGGEEEAHGYRHHHHDANSATVEDCLLEKVGTRTVGSEGQPDAAVCNILLLPCTPCLTSFGADVQSDLSFTAFVHKPCVQSYHTIFVARSLGLRAPPAC
ncbi:MAG: hypothetical protein LBO71_03455 [Prevotellaceae bacterium]|nr:hypothetical protein [Prevotellaceae bacterium]